MPVRIGMVNYLNTLPLVQGLGAWSGAECVAAVPSKLAAMLAGDPGRQQPPSIDIGLVSVIDAARSTVPLTLIPAGMIGCDGPTLTVRLFSAVPLERVGTIHADTDSHTSIALCQVVMQRRFGITPGIVDFDARERVALSTGDGRSAAAPHEWPETVLMIGDKVVTASPPAVRYPYQLDLGEAWRAITGLPFVYAAWMCRASDETRPEIISAALMLDRQRRRNASRLNWIVDRFASERGWPPDLARAYLGGYLKYEIGPREEQAVAEFFSACHAMALAPLRTPHWMRLPERRAESPTQGALPAGAASGIPLAAAH